MSRPLLKTVLGLCLIFVLGVFAGFLVDRLIFAREIGALLERKHPMLALVQRRWTRDLSLDHDQQAKLQVILDQAAQKVHAAEEPIQPQLRGVLADSEQQIEAMLRPDQLQKFHEDLARARQQFASSAYFSPETNSPGAAPVGNSAPAPGP
jgi:hypothetical protein